jgi:multidrug efflux pump subunit AcrA (membrane-fusion protein)
LPSSSDFRAEEEEEAPAIVFTITDSAGRVVRRLTGPVTAGMQRISWDLRYPAPSLPPPPNPEGEDPFNEGPSGPLVMPGAYKVSAATRVNGVFTPLGQAQEFQVLVEGQVRMLPAERAALVEFQQKVARLQRALQGAVATANALKPRLVAIRRALLETPNAPEKLLSDAAALDKRTNEIIRALLGDSALRQRNMNLPPSISERIGDIAGSQRMSTDPPTRTQVDQYAAAAQDFETALNQLRQLIEGDLAKLEKQMEAAGAPWTPGRIPEWKDQ